MNSNFNFKSFNFCLIAFALALSGCSGGTTVGNPLVNLKLKSLSALSFSKTLPSYGAANFLNPLNSLNPLEALNPLSVQKIDFCFKRLRFKPTDDTTNDWSDDNIDFNPGNISFTGADINLGSVSLPEGIYDRVEFDLDDRCSTGSSVEVQNTAGTFSTDTGMSIKFEGTFSHQSNSVLSLDLSSLITAADAIAADNEIKNIFESVTGSLQEE